MDPLTGRSRASVAPFTSVTIGANQIMACLNIRIRHINMFKTLHNMEQHTWALDDSTLSRTCLLVPQVRQEQRAAV